jgi:hypothetical protein
VASPDLFWKSPSSPSHRRELQIAPACMETCAYASDGFCDDGGPGAESSECSRGTDCTDCGLRPPSRPPPPPSPPPPPPSPPPPPPPPPPPFAPGTLVVSTSADLTSALANTAVGHILLAPGTYNLIFELNITRSIILEAALAGSAILNAQASSLSQRRVLNINPGPSGIVQLFGLGITGGYTTSYVRARVQKFPSPCWSFHMFRACACRAVVSPSGEAQWPSHRVPSVGTQLHMCVLMFKGSHRRHERLIIWFARCLQGGGVHLNSGTVTITSSSIFGNTAYDVRAHLPIAVIGDSHFARCLQGGGVHVNSDTVTITSSSIYGNTAYWVRAHLQNFLSPSWETHGLLLVCRAAVSLPHLAQSRLRFLRSTGTQLPMCALV